MNVVSSPAYETIYLGLEGETFTRSYSAIGATSTALSLTATDLGDGYYRATFTPSSAGVHVWIGKSSSGIPVSFSWDVVTAQQADPAASLGSNPVNASGPATSSGDFRLIQGDAYTISGGNPLSWTLTGAINLVGETVTFVPVGSGLSITCTVTGAGTTTQTVKAELTSNQTAAFALTLRLYELRATVADVTLAKGVVIIQPG